MTTAHKTLKSRILGALMGAAVGDALGVPHEFCEREYFYLHPVTEMNAYGTHNQPKGTWSDDTSMTLATVNTLVKHIQDTSPMPSPYFLKDLILAFIEWLQTGQYSPHGEAFDIGNTTHGALMDYVITPNFESSPLVLEGSTSEHSQGNGSLMRFAPFALWHAIENWSNDTLAQCSQVTHGHPVVIDACVHYANTFRFSRNTDFETAVQLASEMALQKKASYVPDLKTIWERNEYEVKSTGYVVDSLEAAYWCIYTGNGYQDSVLKAVNLGGDTDTIASITGSLSGWLEGLQAIPRKWLETLQQRSLLEKAYGTYCENLLIKETENNKNEK